MIGIRTIIGRILGADVNVDDGPRFLASLISTSPQPLAEAVVETVKDDLYARHYCLGRPLYTRNSLPNPQPTSLYVSESSTTNYVTLHAEIISMLLLLRLLATDTYQKRTEADETPIVTQELYGTSTGYSR